MHSSARWVLPVRSVSRWRRARSASQGLAGAARSSSCEGDLQLVQVLVAGLVDPGGLAGGAHEHAGEGVRQRRVVLPVGDEAGQQGRVAQQWAVGGGGAADCDVVAAPGAGVAAVEVELLGAQAHLVGVVVEAGGQGFELTEAGRGLHVDLDHAGVGGHAEAGQAGVAGQGVALDHHGRGGGGSRRLHRSHQVEGPFQAGHRGQEDPGDPVAGLDHQRGADDQRGIGHQGRGERRPSGVDAGASASGGDGGGGLQRIGLDHRIGPGGGVVGQGVEREPQPHGRGAGGQEQLGPA